MSRQVVVTGAGSGIGAATAAALSVQGDRVISLDRADADVVADLSTPQGRASAVGEVAQLAGGGLDAVVACAGTSTATPLDVKVNYFGVVDLLNGLQPILAKSAAPRVVVTSSVASIFAGDPALVAACLDGDEDRALVIADQIVQEGRGREFYNSSKKALSQWVRRTAISDAWAGAGIALNAVGPGVVETPMTASLRASPEGTATMNKAVPSKLGGWMAPEVIAEVLVWLVRAGNTHTTAQVIFVDGGAEAVIRGQETF